VRDSWPRLRTSDFPALQRSALATLDVTGGSPEMKPDFRWLVERARGVDLHVIDRCNPTIYGG